ncbi:ParA family protein [Apilactobacillus micheneri]|uniref:ParA family protein n=1 Tax=Apilactobacillus micheneri TaxID=1899430 RepID=UPI00112C0EE1|nr:AAA family ATPase [Apilactobacillus micheneri]TPR41292.1 ParA family protein [Apilactobacillus micheneri]
MAITITTGNFKGGVGKTTNATMLAYTLSKKGKKVLLVDLDPQANATALMFTTMQKVYGIEPDFEETLETALTSGSLSDALINVHDNLDLLPSYEDLQGYERFLSDTFDDDYSQDHYFNKLLSKIKDNYDYVILDVPPQLNRFTDSALVASDYVIIILQTQERSLTGAETYARHLLQIRDDYDLGLDLLGVLPVLQQNGNTTDVEVIDDAIKSFGKDNMFQTQIKQMARLKRFDRTGITSQHNSQYDRKVHHVYKELCKEMENRIEKFKKGND